MRKLRGEAYAFSAGRKSKLLDYPKYIEKQQFIFL